MPVVTDIQEFITLAQHSPVIDVRTPAEFAHGHFPGAVNLPLFSNDERVVVGTLYKREGRYPAILKGLEYTGPKMKDLTRELHKTSADGKLLMYCWRGGMRSASVAWLAELTGLKVHVLKGGYKTFRRYMRSVLEKKYNINVLGGNTGSGKTQVLQVLKQRGQYIIDLEKLAHHKGSAYGHLEEKETSTQEDFENALAWELLQIPQGEMIWLEDESRMVGRKVIPETFYLHMRNNRVHYLDVPFDVRARYLADTYGKCKPEELAEATRKIEKRLGSEQCRDAIAFIRENNMLEACKISLRYYDKAYMHNLQKRKVEVIKIPVTEINPEAMASALLQEIAENVWKK